MAGKFFLVGSLIKDARQGLANLSRVHKMITWLTIVNCYCDVAVLLIADGNRTCWMDNQQTSRRLLILDCQFPQRMTNLIAIVRVHSRLRLRLWCPIILWLIDVQILLQDHNGCTRCTRRIMMRDVLFECLTTTAKCAINVQSSWK